MSRPSFNDVTSGIAAISAIAALIIAVLAWIYPNSPPPFEMEGDKLYENETPIGLAVASRTDPVLMGQLVIRVITAKTLQVGQTLGFHNARCTIIERSEEPVSLSADAEPYLSQVITCRIIGR